MIKIMRTIHIDIFPLIRFYIDLIIVLTEVPGTSFSATSSLYFLHLMYTKQ